MTYQEPIVEESGIDEKEEAQHDSRKSPSEQDRVHLARNPSGVQEEQQEGEDCQARAAQSHGQGAVFFCGLDVDALAVPAAPPGFPRRVERRPLSSHDPRNRRLLDKMAAGIRPLPRLPYEPTLK